VASYTMQAQTDVIPVVFGFSGDPVEAGLVVSYARPGRNMTGMTFLGEKLTAKRLELLKQAAPAIARVAVLAYPGHPGERREWHDAQAAAQSLGLALRRLEVTTSDDFERAFAALASEPTDALLAFSDNITLANRARMAEVALARRLPSMFGWREYAEAGGLLSYGPNLEDSWGRIAVYADRILKGANPADLPVEEPTTFELMVNLKTARTLGLAIPASVLTQADEIIQ
jgi:putative tryptophan/tyrosine transport system substrate-binding protein